MGIVHFDSCEDMFAAVAQAQKAADAAVIPAQAQMVAGDYFVRHDHSSGIVIYGEILDPAKPNGLDLSSAECEEDAQIYAQPHMKHVRFCRCYSVVVPHGELGDVHVSRMDVQLSKHMFDVAREGRWPNDPSGEELVNLLDAAEAC